MIRENATGDLLPQMVVDKAANLYQGWTKGSPSGIVYSHTHSSWFDMVHIEKEFLEILLPHIKEIKNSDRRVVIGDNLASLFPPTAIEASKENNIFIVALPPNSTFELQPYLRV